MLRSFAFVPLLLGACSAAPAEPVIHGETPGHTCKAEGTDQFVGQSQSKRVGAAIKRASNAALLRWAPPGVMLTMDFRADRVTVWLDDASKITKIRCG
jgi:Peptidase inhibitor I78 family